MRRIDNMCTTSLTGVLELLVLNSECRGDRYRLDDGRGLDLIQEPLTGTQDLPSLIDLLTVCTIGEPLCCRGT